jgi:hypothetical protein
MDFSEIRRTVIIAMFSDDVLMELVVLYAEVFAM